MSGSIAVLAGRRDAAAVGAAAGLALGRGAVVCTWTGEEGLREELRAPASAAARRLAEALDAVAAGRLVRVSLPADEAAAAAAVRRVMAVSGELPVVVALGAARTRIFDVLIGEADRVVVAARRGDEAIAAIAADRLGHAAVTCAVDPTPVGRAMALAGAWVAPCLRPVAEAVRS